MNINDVTKNEALKFVTEKQYRTLTQGKASEELRFKLWINIIESRKLNPLKITLPDFYV